MSGGDAVLSDGPFLHAQEMDHAWVRSMEPDRFLAGFRLEAGLGSDVPRYGGWEDSGASGHAFGHWLSASARLLPATRDSVLARKLTACVEGLAACQAAEGTSLVAGFPESRRIFAEIRRGDIRAQGFDLNGGWVPLYTEHKVSLLDVWHYARLAGYRDLSDRAWNVLVPLAGYFADLFDGLSDEQLQTVLICEHGGLQEVFLNLYMVSGDPRYLAVGKRLEHRAFLEPLERGEDRLAGEHANMEIPKVIGLVREYEATGEERCLAAAQFFWDRVVNHHSYVIGGNSEREHFGQPDHLEGRLSGETCETCNTYNMLKLTESLYRNDPRSEYVDFYERALFNQILGSQNPADGMVCYMSPLGDRCRKNFSLPYDSFWCCVGTGMENHAKYGAFIYAKDPGAENLYVNMYIPSSWEASESLSLEQVTGFPFSDGVTLRVHPRGKRSLATLHLRHPRWSEGPLEVRLNGKRVQARESDGYLSLRRKWKEGDEVTFTLRPVFRSEALPGDPGRVAWLWGPLVLAAPVAEDDPVPLPRPGTVPSLENREELRFTLETQDKTIGLCPYYQGADRATVVYFNNILTQ